MQLPATPRELAMRFGVITDGSSDPALREELGNLMALLGRDVSDDQTIGCDHPRFFEHTQLLTLFADSDPEAEARIDSIGFSEDKEANAIEREAIEWVRATWLK